MHSTSHFAFDHSYPTFCVNYPPSSVFWFVFPCFDQIIIISYFFNSSFSFWPSNACSFPCKFNFIFRLLKMYSSLLYFFNPSSTHINNIQSSIGISKIEFFHHPIDFVRLELSRFLIIRSRRICRRKKLNNVKWSEYWRFRQKFFKNLISHRPLYQNHQPTLPWSDAIYFQATVNYCFTTIEWTHLFAWFSKKELDELVHAIRVILAVQIPFNIRTTHIHIQIRR